MEDLKLADLLTLVGKKVIVQEDMTGRSTDGDDYREVEGKVLRASDAGLVLQDRVSIVPIKIQHILGWEEVTRPAYKRLIKRWIREATLETVKQHLVDRHGTPFDLVGAKEMTPEVLLQMHNGIDHSNLGHGHGPKPPSKRGRKPNPRPGAVPQQRSGDHDNLADEIIDEVSDD